MYSINQDRSVVPASRLANMYTSSKEFFMIKQHLDQKLEVALGEPLGREPHYAANFFWQVIYIDHIFLLKELHLNM